MWYVKLIIDIYNLGSSKLNFNFNIDLKKLLGGPKLYLVHDTDQYLHNT